MKRAVTATVIGLVLLGIGPSARATLDPARAQADADAVLVENDAFCKDPSRPLSPRARSLCDLAPEVPRCDGFAKACAEAAPDRQRATSKEEKENKADASSWRSSLAAFARLAVWVMLALVVAAIFVPVVQAVLRRRRDKQLADTEPARVIGTGPAPPPPEPILTTDDPERLLARASELARRGELDAALYTYLRASLSALDARGAVRVARHRTNGEYVRSCKEVGSRDALREIVLEVDRAQFGAKPVTPERVASVGQRAFAVVRAAPAALVLALVVFLGGLPGCDGGHRAKGARDPAGTEVMAGILGKQGVEVSGLGGSLLSLPLPDPGAESGEESSPSPSGGALARGPAVVVNASSTELDAEVEAHLIAWVEAGGFLILTGPASSWPHRLGAATDHAATSKEIVVTTKLKTLHYDADDEDDDEKRFERVDKGFITRPAAFKWSDPPEQATTIARTADDHIFAALLPMKRGSILVLASDELFSNASLARKDNPGALVAILAHVDRKQIKIAMPEDGIAPVTNPMAGLHRAGLGLATWHAIAAAIVLFLAVGIRLVRPKPTSPPPRRAFAEHVEATGALYANTHQAAHALAAFARYARERVRARLPRGVTDPAAFLAQRSGKPPEECSRIWERSMSATTDASPRGDELLVLRDLSALYAAATRTEKEPQKIS
jgi:hypothetical protein